MVNKSPLQIQAYNYLKEMILSGRLDPEVLYSETRMSAEIGISRTPMREAIQCLSQDGYITVVPSKGFTLRKLNEEDMEESIQIRCAIEGFCIHKAAAEAGTRKGQKLLSAMEKLLDKQEKTLLSKMAPAVKISRAGTSTVPVSTSLRSMTTSSIWRWSITWTTGSSIRCFSV